MAKLNAAGISVVAHDNQGCGRSEAARGLRFYIESFDDFVKDVLLLRGSAGAQRRRGCGLLSSWARLCHRLHSKALQFPLCRELVKQEGFDSLPVFLGGISLGGCIALTSLLEEVGA